MHLRSLTPALAAVAATLIAVPAASAALVIPGQSIGKVKLRQTATEVRRELGRPTKVTGQLYPGFDWHYASRKLDIYIGNTDNATGQKSAVPYVYAIVDQNPMDHTAKGIHIGSKMRAVRHAYPKLRCEGDTDGPCLLGRIDSGGNVFNYTFFDRYAGPIVELFEIGTDTCCYGQG